MAAPCEIQAIKPCYFQGWMGFPLCGIAGVWNTLLPHALTAGEQMQRILVLTYIQDAMGVRQTCCARV